jgi:hypothetical protein
MFRERSRRVGEAIEAARSAARGKSRAGARRRIVAELKAHGIMLPPPSVDLILHDVMLGTGAAGGIRRTAWHLGNAADLAGLAVRFISAAARRQSLPRWDLGGVRRLGPAPYVLADVILDPTAQESLAVGAGDITDATGANRPRHSPLRSWRSCSHWLTHSSPALRVFSSRSLCAGRVRAAHKPGGAGGLAVQGTDEQPQLPSSTAV